MAVHIKSSWRRGEDDYVILYLGHWAIGRYERLEDETYELYCYLPGLKGILGEFETVEEAIERFQKSVNFWISKAGIGD